MAKQAAPAPDQINAGGTKKRIRKVFGNVHEVVQMPNLIEVQRESYEQFLRSDPKTGFVSGLEKTLRSVFPIMDFAGTAHLDFDRYELEPPKYDVDECRQRGMTYAAPMRVTLRLIVFEVDPDTETRSVLDIKEQDVYMGDMPLMTHNGTFIINGTERVIVSQMHRSPGVLFDHDRGKTHSSGKLLFAARVIPYRGSWLDFEFDARSETRSVLDIKEQDVYMGDMPLMTHNGTFIINGTERVIVSQMHRSPGVLFDHDRGKTHSSGKLLFAARVIPYRGSWLDFEFDA